MYNSQPTAAFKRKPLQKDELVLTIPAHSIMDKQLFSPPFFSGKGDFPLFAYSKEAAPVWSRATQKSFRRLFAAIVGVGAAAGKKEERGKRKGERGGEKGERSATLLEGVARLPFPATFKANLVTARSKNTSGNKSSQSGASERVSSFSSHCFLRSAAARHRSID